MNRQPLSPSSPTSPTSHPAAVEREQAALETVESVTPARPSIDDGALWERIWRWIQDNTFLPSWLPEPLCHPLVAFALAATLELLASVATLLLVAAAPNFSFLDILHLLMVALIALTWGAAPSLLAAVVGVISLEVIVLPQAMGDSIGRPGTVLEVVVFLVICGIICVIASSTERARRHAVDDYAAAQARELALRETRARTDEFLSIASHELRSPLTALKAALQLGKRRLRRLADQEQPIADFQSQVDVVQGLLSTAEQQVDRQDRLVGDLLDVSRIRANKLEYHLAPCDLVALVSDAVDEQRLSWPDRTISFDEPAEEAPIEADAHRIGQVVTNFLTNALKYSPPDAPVNVSVRLEGAQARVAVRDQGPGLSTEQQSHIWDRFHRVPGIKQQSGSGAGLGLGLHISRTIVEYHHGEVGIISAPKQGATFWFTIPLAQEGQPSRP